VIEVGIVTQDTWVNLDYNSNLRLANDDFRRPIQLTSNMSTVATDNEELQALRQLIQAAPLSDEAKSMIQQVIDNQYKISAEEVLAIWRIFGQQQKIIPGLNSQILWVETGTSLAGMKHILKHKEDFANQGVPETKLLELAEAATKVGYPAGFQGKGKKGRPILLLYFYDKPLGVAITVGNNGFVVGMNPRNFQEMLTQSGVTEDKIKEVSSWPQIKLNS
jgi:hypothetical protein